MKKKIFKVPSGATLNITALGFGSAPIGNLYRPVSDKDAQATLEAAWKAGIRYFDTAPLYGLGLSETRLNQFLRSKKRSDYGDFDMFLLASRYTLLEQGPITSFLPLCQKRGIGIIIGGAYNSGILASGAKPGATYDYSPAPRDIMERVRKIEAVCKKHKVKLVEAALRFPLLHPSVVSVIPGAVSPAQVATNIKTLSQKIPAAFWADLKAQGLMDQAALT